MSNRSLFSPWVWVCVYLFLFLICGNNAWGQAVVGSSIGPNQPIGHLHAFLWNNGVMQDLGTLPGGTDSRAFGINNACQVVGDSFINEAHAFLWSNGVMQDLGMLPGPFPSASASGINHAGQVVGTSSGRAFLWSNGVMQDLGALPGGNFSSAYGINDAGQVVGDSQVGGGSTGRHPFLWSNGVMQDLGILSGQLDGAANGINNSGQVVGKSGGRAVLWSNGVMQDLGTLPGGTGAAAFGINNIGQVVGVASTSGGQTHAFLWSAGGGMQDLGTLPGGTSSVALGINNLGQVVGYADTFDGQAVRDHAFLWSNGVMLDLGVLPGLLKSSAYGAADVGCGPFPDFALSASPASQSVVQGGSTSYTVTITSSGGFSNPVTLSISGLPSGVTATFSPNPATTTSTLNVTTMSSTPPGTYTLTITGTSGSLTRTTQATVVVSLPPSLSASPAQQIVLPGGLTTYTVYILGVVSTPLTLSVSGLPAGASGSFVPNPATTPSTLIVTTAASTPLGTYMLTITGTNSSLTLTTTATLIVNPPQVTFDNFTHTDYQWDVTSITTPEFLISNHANRAAMIMIAMPENNATNITASLGGVAGTLVPGTDSGTTASMRTLIYQVINPPPGMQTATVSWDNTRAADIAVVVVSGANQATPVTNGTFVATDSSPDAVTSLTVASNPGDFTVSIAVNSNAWVSTNQILIFLDSGSVGGGNAPRTGTTTVTWTGQFPGEVHSISAGNFKAF